MAKVGQYGKHLKVAWLKERTIRQNTTPFPMQNLEATRLVQRNIYQMIILSGF
ncbi:Uncharacterised protein [Serratia quinivorans]|nr:Uncharacterised protein [Serratia quinivorans]